MIIIRVPVFQYTFGTLLLNDLYKRMNNEKFNQSDNIDLVYQLWYQYWTYGILPPKLVLVCVRATMSNIHALGYSAILNIGNTV